MPLTSPTLETSPTLLTDAGEATPGSAVLPLGVRGIQLLVGGRDLTARCDSLTFSAVDRGGFEICTFGLPKDDRPPPGSRVIVRHGCSVAWEGRVAETAQHSIHGRGSKTTGAEGYQALLKDNPYAEIYVDRDLTRWKGASVRRQQSLVPSHQPQTMEAGRDASTPSVPWLLGKLVGPWGLNTKPIAEAWYDSTGIPISRLYYAWEQSTATINAADENWNWATFLASDDIYSAADTSGNLRAVAASGAGALSATAARYFAMVQFNYILQTAVEATFAMGWERLAVYGTHGLPRRGEEPAGFYPSDIARHALAQAVGIDPGVIIDSTGYIAPHVVYREPTDPAQIIDDMAKLLGWTWGVWGPTTMFGTGPRLDFRPPPRDATCAISKAECDEVDITLRLGDLYDTAVVSYTDAAGTLGTVTVKIPNAQLAEAGISPRTLLLSAGLSSQAAAETLGNFALALSQIASRGAGQATLPSHVRLANGASKPSMLLRPGIDRIRITDLSEAGSLMDYGNSRRDVFRISRVETQVTREGAPNTRVEIDNGSNLLETLQARLALAAGVVGAGASG